MQWKRARGQRWIGLHFGCSEVWFIIKEEQNGVMRWKEKQREKDGLELESVDFGTEIKIAYARTKASLFWRRGSGNYDIF